MHCAIYKSHKSADEANACTLGTCVRRGKVHAQHLRVQSACSASWVRLQHLPGSPQPLHGTPESQWMMLQHPAGEGIPCTGLTCSKAARLEQWAAEPKRLSPKAMSKRQPAKTVLRTVLLQAGKSSCTMHSGQVQLRAHQQLSAGQGHQCAMPSRLQLVPLCLLLLQLPYSQGTQPSCKKCRAGVCLWATQLLLVAAG